MAYAFASWQDFQIPGGHPQQLLALKGQSSPVEEMFDSFKIYSNFINGVRGKGTDVLIKFFFLLLLKKKKRKKKHI